ncbi:aminotransferase class I/II-fold pyridoxal phosphate-dependent enzyme [Aeoliella sp.]|uniref:aminotransferase class I/II-fold pyridoxal phosphate-dependent enzyme n=1 Tax=Aeoliella sp. TaxID=2795800 RepID=UPI003CCBECD4
MRSEQWISELLAKLAREGLERRLAVHPADGAVCDFTSNDYLNLSTHPDVVAAMQAGTMVGSGASRLVSGTREIHQEFEQQLAAYFGKPAALVFGAGYLANLGLLSSYLGRNDTVFADRLVHASLIDGIQLSDARHQRFQHNDAAHLEQLLVKTGTTRKPGERWLVVVESVYSMDGDVAPLAAIAELAIEHDAQLLVDEAHALGVFGPAGRGVAAELDISDQVPLVTGTLSKAFGSYGGVVVASDFVRQLLVNRARPFIYNTALPPALLLAASESLRIIGSQAGLGDKLLELAAHFRRELHEQGLEVGPSASQIVPVMVGDNQQAVQLAEALHERGILVKAIRPPTVPVGTARLRFSVTLAHNEQLLTHTAQAVAEAARSIGQLE